MNHKDLKVIKLSRLKFEDISHPQRGDFSRTLVDIKVRADKTNLESMDFPSKIINKFRRLKKYEFIL